LGHEDIDYFNVPHTQPHADTDLLRPRAPYCRLLHALAIPINSKSHQSNAGNTQNNARPHTHTPPQHSLLGLAAVPPYSHTVDKHFKSSSPVGATSSAACLHD